MTQSRLQRLRTREINRLNREILAAIERIKQHRAEFPDINVNHSGIYLDCSVRDDVDDYGGTVRPSMHVWEIGRILDQRFCIYEEVDWEAWRKAVFEPEVDLGTFAFAATNRQVVMYHNQGVFLGTITPEQLKRTEWTLDMLIEVNDMTARFYTPSDVQERIRLVTDEISFGVPYEHLLV